MLWFFVAFGMAAVGVALFLLGAIVLPEARLDRLSRSARYAIVVAVALVVRIVLALHGPRSSLDLHWYADYVSLLRLHAVPYTPEFFFPYPQGFLDFLKLFVAFANAAPAIHGALILIDCCVAAGIVLLLERLGSRAYAFWAGVGYGVMPMAAVEVGALGHFETIVNLCVVALMFALLAGRAFLAGAAFAAATIFKVFPVVAAPALAFVCRRARDVVYLAAGAIVVVVLSLLPVGGELHQVWAYWVGATPSSPAQAPAFVANSFPAIAADFHFASWLVPALKLLAIVTALATLSYAIVRSSSPRFEALCRKGAFVALFAAFLVYGVYLCAKPWAQSHFAYYWWQPTPVTIGSGVASIALALLGFYAVGRDTQPVHSVQLLAVLVADCIAFAVLAANNVNPWYLMPVVALLLLVPLRASVVAIACVLAFYASDFNSTSFASLGWNDAVTGARHWRMLDVAGNHAYGRVRRLSDGVRVWVRGREAGRPQPRVAVVADAAASVYPNLALAFDVRSDTDPTFHAWPLALSAYVSGADASARSTGFVPVLSQDHSMTDLGTIRMRFPLFALPSRVAKVGKVKFVVAATGAERLWHALDITNVRLADEERWGPSVARATAAIVLCVIAGVLALAALVCIESSAP